MRSHILGCIELDQECLREGLGYLASVSPVEEEYGELDNGLWKNIPLYNASGGSDDRLFGDLHSAPAQSPEHVEHVPYLNETVIMVSNVERLQMARTRNLKNAVVIPRRDLAELDQYFRIHLMFGDSPPAIHSDDDTVIHKRVDEIWFLDPTAVHSAVDLPEFDRQSLRVDLAFEGAFDEKEAFAYATAYTPNRSPDIDEHLPSTKERAQELDEHSPLTSWYRAGEQGPGEQ
ncbi:aspartyl/asparaginyl beta-hydroxylase domain-containing protein [Streptomyces sp. QTS52]